MNNYSIDVWYDDPITGREGICGAEALISVSQGKKFMNQFLKDGKTSVRMYVAHDTDESKKWYYYFQDGKIVKESNAFNN